MGHLEHVEHLSRIVVVGTSGAGKSFIGSRLAAKLGSTFIELDELFWGPAWQPKPEEQFVALVRQAAAGDRWVAAGNYSSARQELWRRATAVVWLNFSLPLVLGRVVRRTVRRQLSGEVLWHGNRESVMRTLFTRESIIWWTLTTHRRRQRQFAALRRAGHYPHVRWYEFTEPSEVDRFLASGGDLAHQQP